MLIRHAIPSNTMRERDFRTFTLGWQAIEALDIMGGLRGRSALVEELILAEYERRGRPKKGRRKAKTL